MQSGITASQELVSQFNELLTTNTHFGLLATIVDERLQPLALLTPAASSGSFADNVSALLTPHVKSDAALYMLLRRHSSPPHLTAVTYVPDSAPVRQKMLFASTRLTLVRELGTEHFRETLFATSAAELTPAGFEKQDKHAALDAPLSEEERVLGEVRRAEQEVGSGTGTRETHLSKNFAMPVQPSAIEAMRELAAGERHLIMLNINSATETVELVPDSSNPTSIPDLVSTISATEPRFTFFRFAHSHNGSNSSPVLFIYTCPANPNTKSIKNRMLYPLMKRAVLDIADKQAGLQPEKRLEVEEPAEVTEASVLSELHPTVEARQGFSRPKRPGR